MPYIDRRGAIALGVGAAAFGGPVHATAKGLDPADADDARQIYRKLRYRTDTGLVFWWIKGPFLGEIGAQLTPMYNLNTGAIQRVTHNPDGSFDVRDLEINFYTDLDSGARLTQFRNPITHETVAVPPIVARPYRSRYTKDNALIAHAVPGGMRFDLTHYPSSPMILGDLIGYRDRTRAVVSIPGQRTRVLNEISTFTAKRDVVLDPAITSAPTNSVSNDVFDWQAWLRMEDRPGVMALYALGGKVASLADMPGDWLDMFHEVLPNVAADVFAALDGPAQN